MKTWWTGMEIFQLPPAKKYNAEHWASPTNKPCGMNTRWADNQYNHVLIIYHIRVVWPSGKIQHNNNTTIHPYIPTNLDWVSELQGWTHGSTALGFWTFHMERAECHFIGTTMQCLWRHSTVVQCCNAVKLQPWSAPETHSNTLYVGSYLNPPCLCVHSHDGTACRF